MAATTYEVPDDPFSEESQDLLEMALRRQMEVGWPNAHGFSLLYDGTCRLYGASDFAALFYLPWQERMLADGIARTFPAEFIQHSLFMMEGTEDRKDSPFASDEVPIRTMFATQNLSFESWWNKLKGFLDRSVIVETRLSDIWVPYFCARPSEQTGGKFKYSVSLSNSSKVGFSVGVPGLGGGFGASTSVQTKFNPGTELTEEEQFQLQMVGLVLVREDRFGRKTESFSPSHLSKTRVTTRSSANYIRYTKSSGLVTIDLPHDHDASDSWIETKVTKNSDDHFNIQVPIGIGSSAGLKVESSCKSEFLVEHNVTSGNTYTRLASSKAGHDITIGVAPTL